MYILYMLRECKCMCFAYNVQHMAIYVYIYDGNIVTTASPRTAEEKSRKKRKRKKEAVPEAYVKAVCVSWLGNSQQTMSMCVFCWPFFGWNKMGAPADKLKEKETK